MKYNPFYNNYFSMVLNYDVFFWMLITESHCDKIKITHL